MVPDPEFASAQSKVGGMGDSEAPPLPGKKSVDLAAKPKKKGTLTDDEVKNRNGELMVFRLEGDTGKFGKEKIQDILCVCFAQYDQASGEKPEKCAIITGAQDGSIIFWVQNKIPPDSDDEDTDDEDETYRSKLDWWDSSGKIIRTMPDIHKGGVPLGPPRSVRERERDLRRVLLVLFESSERGDGRTGDRRTGVGNSGRAEFWRRIAVNVSSPGTLPPGTLLLCVWLLLFPLMLSTMRRRGADAGR